MRLGAILGDQQRALYEVAENVKRAKEKQKLHALREKEKQRRLAQERMQNQMRRAGKVIRYPKEA